MLPPSTSARSASSGIAFAIFMRSRSKSLPGHSDPSRIFSAPRRAYARLTSDISVADVSRYTCGFRSATMIASGTFQTAPMCAMIVGTVGKPFAISSIAKGAQNASSRALMSTGRPSSAQTSNSGSSSPWSATWYPCRLGCSFSPTRPPSAKRRISSVACSHCGMT